MTETQINQIIADNLKIIRTNTFLYKESYSKVRRKCLTQVQVAAAMNCTFQQIQKYEKGINQVSSAKLKILADYFQVPIQDMYKPINTYHREIGNEGIFDVVLDN